MTSKGAPGWSGPLGERMECVAPSVVGDDGLGKGSLHYMNEFFPDIGDLNIYKRSAEIEDIHSSWIEWGTANKFGMPNFTGITCQVC